MLRRDGRRFVSQKLGSGHQALAVDDVRAGFFSQRVECPAFVDAVGPEPCYNALEQLLTPVVVVELVLGV